MMTAHPPYQVCSFCVMDTSVPFMRFDANGQCDCCKEALARRPHEWWPDANGARKLEAMVHRLKAEGQGKAYDCMIGLSGGIDSAYLAHLAVREWGLRVLAVHVDGGWNTEVAVHNIETLVRALDLDLHTYVVEWNEMRDLQKAFLTASVLNQDIPQDHLFFSTLYSSAMKFGIKHFLSGVNYATESVQATNFGFPYSDDIQLRAIHRRFGQVPLKNYPVMPFARFLWQTRVSKQLKVHRPLNCLDYSKDKASQLLRAQYGWREYGGKHSESRFTSFYQNIYLPRKFGFDKRRLHLSSLIVSGQISRADALLEIKKPIISEMQANRDIRFVGKKLGLNDIQINQLINSPSVPHSNYPNMTKVLWLLNRLKKVTQLIQHNPSGRG